MKQLVAGRTDRRSAVPPASCVWTVYWIGLGRPYPEKSRRMLREFLQAHLLGTCDAQERERFAAIMAEKGLDDIYLGQEDNSSRL